MFPHLEQFIAAHRGCGGLTSDVSEAFEAGYQVVIECSCGATFEQWVDGEVAEHDLIYSGLPAVPN